MLTLTMKQTILNALAEDIQSGDIWPGDYPPDRALTGAL